MFISRPLPNPIRVRTYYQPNTKGGGARAYASAMAKQRSVRGWRAWGGGGWGGGRSSRRDTKAPWSGRAGRFSRFAARRTPAMPRPSSTQRLAAVEDAMRRGGGARTLRAGRRGRIRGLGFLGGGVFEARAVGKRKTARPGRRRLRGGWITQAPWGVRGWCWLRGAIYQGRYERWTFFEHRPVWILHATLWFSLNICRRENLGDGSSVFWWILKT